MRKLIIPLTILLFCFPSCKEECKTCEYEVYYNGELKENLTSSEVYCGEDLELIESEAASITVGPLKRVRTCKDY